MFTLTIATVGKQLFRGEAASVTSPGSEGEFTVLPHHEPFITTLKEGVIRIRTAEEEIKIPVKKGHMEVSHNEAVMLL